MSVSSAFKILALGPNPAFQRVVRFDSPITLGGINRAAAVDTYVGGKGQGAAMAANRFAPGGGAAVAHFLGGDTGKYIEATLSASGIDQIIQPVSVPTRTCTTLTTLGDASQTELIDPSGSISETELEGLVQLTADYLNRHPVGGIAICGTTPPGAQDFYESVARLLLRQDSAAVLLLDSAKGVDGVLSSGRVDVLKINVDEAKALTQTSSAELAAEALLHAPDAPLRQPGAMVALTDGPRPARMFFKRAPRRSYTLAVPAIECVNAIGAGDVCTGVFIRKLVEARRSASAATVDEDGAEGADEAAAVDAFAWGLAAACARCTHDLPEGATREEVEAMRERIRVEEV